MSEQHSQSEPSFSITFISQSTPTQFYSFTTEQLNLQANQTLDNTTQMQNQNQHQHQQSQQNQYEYGYEQQSQSLNSTSVQIPQQSNNPNSNATILNRNQIINQKIQAYIHSHSSSHKLNSLSKLSPLSQNEKRTWKQIKQCFKKYKVQSMYEHTLIGFIGQQYKNNLINILMKGYLKQVNFKNSNCASLVNNSISNIQGVTNQSTNYEYCKGKIFTIDSYV